MKIALIYNYESPLTTGAYIERVIKNSGIKYELFGVKNPLGIPQGFDLYFRIDHGDYNFDIPDDLHPAIFYVIDTHLKKPLKKIKRQVKHYDIVFCAQKEGVETLRREVKVDAQWLPLACDPGIHKNLGSPKKYDIGFVGRDAQKFARGKQLQLLRKKFTDSFIGQIDFQQMSEIYSASRIGFNSSIANDINMRIFEIMASGCFLLTNRIKKNGLYELFEEGKHLVTYRNDREMIKLILYYLGHENEREQIARQGYELICAKHTYFHRVQTLFNYIAFKFSGNYNSLRI
jgi:spore maturation protein CgeB